MQLFCEENRLVSRVCLLPGATTIISSIVLMNKININTNAQSSRMRRSYNYPRVEMLNSSNSNRDRYIIPWSIYEWMVKREWRTKRFKQFYDILFYPSLHWLKPSILYTLNFGEKPKTEIMRSENLRMNFIVFNISTFQSVLRFSKHLLFFFTSF